MDEARVKRARLRAWRRGFREADLILGSFADARAAAMSEAELASFERLLDANDQDLYAWIIGVAPAPAAYEGSVLAAIRDHARTGLAVRGG
jgi:antitoxin CptB